MGGGVPTSICSLAPFSHNKMSAVFSIIVPVIYFAVAVDVAAAVQ